jgi:hypothetical protein
MNERAKRSREPAGRRAAADRPRARCWSSSSPISSRRSPAALKIFVATGAFMVAMIAAMLFSAIRYRHISPLLWFSA